MDIGSADERGACRCVMAVKAEPYGQSGMAVTVAIEISGMTSGTGSTTIIGESSSVWVVHGCRMGGRRSNSLNDVTTTYYMT